MQSALHLCQFLFQVRVTCTSAQHIPQDLSTQYYYAVKCNLMEFTTKSTYIPQVVSGFDTYAHVSDFQVLMDRSVVYVQEAFFFCIFVVAAHCPGSFLSTLLPSFQHCDSSSNCRSWLSCQDLPAMGAVFI